MTKKFLANDDSVVYLENREDLKKYLDFRKKNDEWLNVYINEMAAVGIKNEPLFFPEYCHNIKVRKNGYTIHIPDIDYDNEENHECIEDTGLFLIFPYKNHIIPYPTRRIAFASICKRADDDCGTMYRFDVKPNKGVLPIDEKAQRLTRDYLMYSDNCKILLRDGKVSAALSKEYAILPADELILSLEAQLTEDHPDFQFDKGSVSHEFLMAEYLLNDRSMEETFRLKLNDAGADIANLKAGIRFSTSDVGASRVYASIFYDADGVRTTLGGGIAIEHKGEASPEKFGEAMKNLGMVLKECEEQIEQLGNIDISDVAGCVDQIREVYTFFPRQIAEAVEEDCRKRFPKGGTAIDVYLALNDIIQRHSVQNDLTPTRYLNLCEQVAKLMKLPFDKIDAGEWNGNKNIL